MRNSWFEHVSKTRKKLSRGKEKISHREAMRKASETWGEVKAKLVKKQAREKRKKEKECAKKPEKATE